MSLHRHRLTTPPQSLLLSPGIGTTQKGFLAPFWQPTCATGTVGRTPLRWCECRVSAPRVREGRQGTTVLERVGYPIQVVSYVPGGFAGRLK